MEITADVLSELIADARYERRRVDEQIAALHVQLDELEQRRDDLTTEEESYQRTLARKFPTAEAPAEEQQTLLLEDPVSDLRHMPRSAAVELAIAEITKSTSFASPSDIEDWLKERRRTDTRDQIGAALAYLNRTDKIRSLGRARWALLR